MRFAFALAAALLAGGCVSSKCHTPTVWKPCGGDSAEPGDTGTPPSIVALSAPTCVDLDSPTTSATLHVTDPDGDAQTIKIGDRKSVV